MDRSLLLDLLAGTEKRLAETDQAIERQRERLAKLAESGQDVTQMEALLKELQRLRQLISGNRDQLLADIPKPPPDQ
jgi:uncharacterized membrane protein YccC